MVNFSAVLFTGMASKAYVDGSIVLVIYVANFLGFVVNPRGTAQGIRPATVRATPSPSENPAPPFRTAAQARRPTPRQLPPANRR